MLCGTIALIGATVAFMTSLYFNKFLFGKLGKNLD